MCGTSAIDLAVYTGYNLLILNQIRDNVDCEVMLTSVNPPASQTEREKHVGVTDWWVLRPHSVQISF